MPMRLLMGPHEYGVEWTLDDTDWSFEEERPMTTHRKKHVVKVPDAASELPRTMPAADDPVPHPTPPEYQEEVLRKLDEILMKMDDILSHLRGQP